MIAAVHLVWGPLGAGPLRRFLASYDAHPAGVDHELVLALNGLELLVDRDARRELDDEIEHSGRRALALPAAMFDLAAYLHLAGELQHERLCFLNSYSEPRADDWLAKLDAGLNEPRAAIVGATGSWFSNRSWALHSLGLPSPYRGLLPGRAIAREQYAQMSAEHPRAEHPDPPPDAERHTHGQPAPSRLGAFLRNLPVLIGQLLWFDSFPAYHLRTNAFMARGQALRSLRTGRLANKMDTYRLESGSHNVTAQLRHAGQRALVVDSAGCTYAPECWDRSRTFWQSDQQALLVADNQTRLYAEGGIERRRLLSALAWGSRSEPAMPSAGGSL